MVTGFDVIVIGGGMAGTSAARWLARRGHDTLLLERFQIGHARGSSGGLTRIFRLSYETPDYVRMARVALDEWRRLEADAGEPLMITTAGLDVGQARMACAQALEAAGIAFERPSVDEAAERWPALRFEPGTPLLLQEDGGVCMAERTVRAQARLAKEAGATVMEETRVDRLVATGTGVEVATEAGTYRAPVAVLTAGPWAGGLLEGSSVELPLRPSLEQVTYFALEEPTQLPTVIDLTEDPASVYAVPDPEAPGRFKIGLHMAGPTVDPDERSFDPDPERVERVSAYAAARFAPHRIQGGTETCLTTNTPDEDFVLDRRGSLVVGSACSGHGFKFAPLIGRILADLATAQPAPLPIERFLAGRFAG